MALYYISGITVLMDTERKVKTEMQREAQHRSCMDTILGADVPEAAVLDYIVCSFDRMCVQLIR